MLHTDCMLTAATMVLQQMVLKGSLEKELLV